MVENKDILIFQQENDFLNLNNDTSIRKFIRDEIVLFSDTIDKVNHYGIAQQRNLLVTNKGIYNLKGKELKRRIDYSNIKGISVTKSTDEFVIHCIDLEYDYYLLSPRKKKLLQNVDLAYTKILQSTLSICALDVKSLSNYVTTKVEKKKDINFTRMPETGLTTVKDYLMGGGFSNEMRKRAFSRIVSPNDYKIIKFIGQDSLFKIYLVEYNNKNGNKEYYAMKIIRKDVVIREDLLDCVKAEVKVLTKTDHPYLLNLYGLIQNQMKIYYILPFNKGGDLYHYMSKNYLDLSQ